MPQLEVLTIAVISKAVVSCSQRKHGTCFQSEGCRASQAMQVSAQNSKPTALNCSLCACPGHRH